MKQLKWSNLTDKQKETVYSALAILQTVLDAHDATMLQSFLNDDTNNSIVHFSYSNNKNKQP